MTWTVEILDKRYTMLAGSSVKWACGELGKHRTSSMTAVVRDLNLAAALISRDGLVDAVIRKGEDVVFTGVIRPYVSISSKYDQTDELELEVLDYTEKMHVKVLERVEGVQEQAGCIFTETIDGLKICAGEGTLVYKLAAKAGVAIASAPTVDVVLQRFELKSGEYLDDTLSSLLYEYLLDYRFDASGRMVIYQTSPDTAHTSTISSFFGSFNIQKTDDPKDGAVVSYDKYLTVDDYKIGEWSDSKFTLAVVGGYDAGFFDAAEKKVTWDLAGLGDKQKAARISNVWASGWSSGPITGTPSVSIDSWDQKGAVISTSGGGWYYAGNVEWGAKIYGDITYLYSEKSSVGYTGKDTDSYTARYIQRTEDAVRLVEAIRKRNASKSVSFSTYEDLEIGGFVRIDEAKITGLDSKIRITQKIFDVITGLYSYTAETVGAVTIAPPDISSEVEVQEPSTDLGPFLEIRADRTQVLQEESDVDIHVSASGYGLDRYGLSVSFFLNSNSIPSSDGRTLTVSKRQLQLGINTIEGIVIHNGRRYLCSLTVAYVQAGQYSSFEYAISTSPDTPPDKLETFFTFGEYLIGYDDAIIVLDDTWTKDQPTPAEGEYVWMRMMSQSGEWVVVRLTGTNGAPGSDGAPAVDFSLTASPASFQNSKRRLSDIVVSIGVTRQNMAPATLFSYALTGSVPYGVTIDSSGLIRIPPGVHPETLTVKVTAGEPYYIEKSITVTGIPAVDGQPQYLGTTASIPPTYSGALLDGDWVMYTSSDGTYSYGHVYKLSGSSWVETTAIKDLIAVQDDATKIIEEQGVYVYAKVIFAQSILAVDMAVTGSFTFESKASDGYVVKLTISPEEGLVMKRGSDTVLAASFVTGKIFLGKPDSDFNSPITGFMYDPASGVLSSKDAKVKINQDGSINASDGYFQGIISAADGVFSGELNSASGRFSGELVSASGKFTGSFSTPTLDSLPRDTITGASTLSIPADAEAQYSVFSSVYESIPNNFTPARLSSLPSVRYLKKIPGGTSISSSITFALYDTALNQVARMYHTTGMTGTRDETTIPAGTLTYGAPMGDILVFKDIQVGSKGLQSGQIYRNTSNQLFIVP